MKLRPAHHIVALAILLLASLAHGAATPAFALDCAKAETPVEKAICGSEALRKADTALGDLYFSTLRALKGDQHDLLRASQRKWLADREDECIADTDACVAASIAERHKTIGVCFGDSRDDGVTSCPYFLHPGCPALEASGSPGLKVYPFLVTKLVSDVKALRDEYDCKADDADDDVNRNMESDSYTIVTERPGLVCVKIMREGDFAGAAHPNSSEAMACYDPATSRKLDFSTVFPTLTADSDELARLLSLVDGDLTLDCCEPATTDNGTFDDLGDIDLLPSGWAVTDRGDLLLAFEYNAYARVFLATATVPRKEFIQDTAPAYRAVFTANTK